MSFSIIKMYRNEYRKEHLAMRDYIIYFLGIPVYKAKFTTTNKEAVRLLTTDKELHTKIKGFNNN